MLFPFPMQGILYERIALHQSVLRICVLRLAHCAGVAVVLWSAP